MHFSRIFIERPMMTALVTFAILLVWSRWVSRFAGCRIAQRRLPNDSGNRRTAGRQSGNDGDLRCDAAGARVLDHRRRAIDEFVEYPGRDDDYDSVRPYAKYRRRSPGRTGRHCARAFLPPSMPRPPSLQKTNPSEQPILYSLSVPRLCRSTRWTNMRKRCSRSGFPWSAASRGCRFSARRNTRFAFRWIRIALAAHGIGIDEVQRAVQQSNINLPTGRLHGR